MDKCADCNWNYPDEYLSQMFIMGGYTNLICGICALKRINEIHEIKLKKFQGEMAEANRLNAINWRKKHPNG